MLTVKSITDWNVSTASSPLLQTTTALNSSVLYKFHAIALGFDAVAVDDENTPNTESARYAPRCIGIRRGPKARPSWPKIGPKRPAMAVWQFGPRPCRSRS